MSARICLLTEKLNPPFDEGYKNFTYNLFRFSTLRRRVLRLGSGDDSVIDIQVQAGKLLLSNRLRKAITDFQPDALMYVPISSITPASFLRARILKSYKPSTFVAMLGLQPRALKPMLRLIAPDIVYVQSSNGKQSLEQAGFRAGIVRAGVDLDRFKPVGRLEKDRLREKHALHPDSFVVLHVGHINQRRNLQILAEIAGVQGTEVIVVGSSSTCQDRSLASWLERRGVRVITGYVKQIEEFYQLSDAYVFPVIDDTAAIELPLSVLEAMACNLKVITTPFGGLKDCFSEGDGLFFMQDPHELPTKVELARQYSNTNTYSKVQAFGWESVVEQLLAEIEELTLTSYRNCRDSESKTQ